MTPEEGETVLAILLARDGIATHVRLADGEDCEVFDVAWARDIDDDYDHVTTNISPQVATEAERRALVDERTIHFFFTEEVVRITDPATGETLFEAGSG